LECGKESVKVPLGRYSKPPLNRLSVGSGLCVPNSTHQNQLRLGDSVRREKERIEIKGADNLI
jgi:hypothetical protein